MPIFYHYTSAKGAKAIVNNPVINASESRGGFPAGAHFTTLGTDYSFNIMSQNSHFKRELKLLSARASTSF